MPLWFLISNVEAFICCEVKIGNELMLKQNKLRWKKIVIEVVLYLCPYFLAYLNFTASHLNKQHENLRHEGKGTNNNLLHFPFQMLTLYNKSKVLFVFQDRIYFSSLVFAKLCVLEGNNYISRLFLHKRCSSALMNPEQM